MRRSSLASIAVGVVCCPILCCWITVASCCCPGRVRRRNECEAKTQFERRQRMAPKPLPVRPPQRSLTIPVPKRLSEKAKVCVEVPPQLGSTFDQSQSRLMQLPLELRQMIYRAVLGDSTIHMILKEKRLGHIRCKVPESLDCILGFNGRALSRECTWGNVDYANIWKPPPGESSKSSDGNIIPFLQTCRQIYSESINFLYTSNCFSFSDLDCLRYFSMTTLPHRFAQIRTLDISICLAWPIYDPITQATLPYSPALYPPHDEATWEATWRIIANMPNLRFIRASLLYDDGFRDPRWDKATEEKVLRPLRQVKTKTFEVHVSWEGEEVEDAPFRLIRPMGMWPYPAI